ncbi:polyphosphate polymerase domain-containing protein [Konateibacter massiliensis]|uniref:polyphosphate polymerase domain-containing protein n=1 Tax=Konateibacter massiliensis TaxID=2002841 RepID=UPI000C15827D|nr:polyphosphate polymerase domain-containing protein [Konateibacter massiliensis]
MADYQGVFKRYEKKYLLTDYQYKLLRERLAEYMEEDSYGLHTINNIYYDTDDYRLIRKSLEKPIYKEKLRLRSYGTPTKDSNVFLEIKKKYDGVVYKRRTAMKLDEAGKYVLDGKQPCSTSQITREIDWFLKSYDLSPKVFIAYDRIALFGKEDADLRITFDTNIRWREENLDLARGSNGRQLLQPGQVLMEIKIPGVMPLWMSHLLNEMEIYSTSFSKYGTCYKNHLIHTFLRNLDKNIMNTQLGGMHCA